MQDIICLNKSGFHRQNGRPAEPGRAGSRRRPAAPDAAALRSAPGRRLTPYSLQKPPRGCPAGQCAYRFISWRSGFPHIIHTPASAPDWTALTQSPAFRPLNIDRRRAPEAMPWKCSGSPGHLPAGQARIAIARRPGLSSILVPPSRGFRTEGMSTGLRRAREMVVVR